MPPEPAIRPSPAPAPVPGLIARALMTGVRGYQILLSPALHSLGGPGCGCRFTPSCSHYALEALALHGPLRGTKLATRRLLRCHPWGASGQDPVPPPQIAAG